MALTVLFLSGPRRSGKSTVTQQLIAECFDKPPHYIRIASRTEGKRPPPDPKPPEKDCGVASASWIDYDEDRVYEFLPAALTRIHRRDRRGFVIIEADADPILRHAYPYDHRIFVMPAPHKTSEIFRTAAQAAKAFHDTLNDTAAFVGEIYGLVEPKEKLDSIDPEASEARTSLTASQLRGLMSTPLGDEIATRILLQPSYHGLIESDVVIVNTAVGGMSAVVDDCVRRLQRVLEHVRGEDGQKRMLLCCDPSDEKDPLRAKLFAKICAMLTPKKANAPCPDECIDPDDEAD